HDLSQVDCDHAVGGLDVVPTAAVLHCLAKLLVGLFGEPHQDHLAAGEANFHPPQVAGLPRHQCAPAAGCTSSVRTPPVEAGCTKATRLSLMPRRGCSSIIRSPRERHCSIAPATSAHRKAVWCMPGPFFARN